MSKEYGETDEGERITLPIEKGFPIEQVNEIAEKEGRAKMHYRPIYTMNKWWARRLGCVFRAISLYTLLDDPQRVSVSEPGENGTLRDFGGGHNKVQEMLESVEVTNPESLWELYPKDVQVDNKKVLDPFMGGGTSLIESSRFGVEADGMDLNPVAWFVTKKEVEAGETDVGELETAFEQVKEEVEQEITQYYQTSCPNGDHDADVMYYMWVKELDCVSCSNTVPLFKDYRVGKGRYEHSDKYNVLCPSCESVVYVDDWKEETECSECNQAFLPSDGTVDSGYVCQDCGQKYGVLEAIQEQGGFNTRLYALEYYCPTCESNDLSKSEVKGYKSIEERDKEIFGQASKAWENTEELNEYVPGEEIPEGIKTDSTLFEGNIGGGHNVLRHGIREWKDMFNERQLLCLSTLLREIDDVESENAKEYLLTAFGGCLRFNSMMSNYQASRNHITNIFKSNSFDPPQTPAENNVWGTEYGMGSFQAVWEMVIKGVEYAGAPTERYISEGETVETAPHNQPIGENVNVHCGDMRNIEEENEYDAVITDPPYYDNVIYSELSDFFYVWQKIILKDRYEFFDKEHTPRSESIVANPAVKKGATEFEDELRQAFNTISNVLKDDGALVFTYHHSGVESWGELLTALCDVGFEITATYPIAADTAKFFEGKAVEFDIIIVGRLARNRHPISWNSLRRDIYRTAQKTRNRLEEKSNLSRGDIGVVEMGRCFHEYSKHHGKVERAGETMTAKEVVEEIYGIIQHGSDIGEIDVFLDLVETPDASYDDLNKLCRGTNATPERMEDMRLYRMDDGFKLGTWDDEKRIAYIQSRVDSDEELTDLDKAQFLRYRWEHGKQVSDYLKKWEITDELRELCEGLADATGDDTYRNILESRLTDY
jgi:adenine-specific DNA methylase